MIDGIDGFGRILDHDNVVAEASRIVADVVFFIAESRSEQAIFETCVCIIVADLVAPIKAVQLGVVVAERKRPVHAEAFHHVGEDSCCVEVVERAGLERYGIRNIARDNDKVGLRLTYHRRNSTHCPVVFRARKRAAADMHVGELKHFEFSVRILCERPIAEFVVKSRRKLLVLGVLDFFKA